MKTRNFFVTMLLAAALPVLAVQSVWMSSSSSSWMRTSSMTPWEHQAARMPYEEVVSTSLEWKSMSAITRVTDGYHCVAGYYAEIGEYGEDAPNLFDENVITPGLMNRSPRRAFDDSPEGGQQSNEYPLGSSFALAFLALAYGGYTMRNKKLDSSND